MRRREDWPERLAVLLSSRSRTPFAWGQHDCCTFAADAIEAVTGTRPEVPEYATAAEAAKLLADRPLGGWLAAILGEPIVPSYMQGGDIALMVLDGRQTAGVCNREYIAAPGEDGLVLLPLSLAVSAWRV